ncbi:MAG: hypothetical protein KIT72_04885 [Polyangiaceae bacterium]|nr:hypothetical protein [Polyangiaceae bacterium]MCW5789739.1 hypothetical protein [Polyangiaceae bacterium]
MPNPLNPVPRLWQALVLSASLGLAACGISPQPEPPADATPGIAPGAIQIFETQSGLQVVGGPGAVTGDLCELRIYNLERAGVRQDESVADDGSFTVELPGEAGDALRLQVRSNDGISEPTDITGVGQAELLTTPLAGCLGFQPARELAFGEVQVGELDVQYLRMTNGCDDDLALFDLAVLVGEPSFSFIIPADPLIPRGQTRVIGVAFGPMATDEQEEVLLVGLEGGSERRAVTLRGLGTPR